MDKKILVGLLLGLSVIPQIPLAEGYPYEPPSIEVRCPEKVDTDERFTLEITVWLPHGRIVSDALEVSCDGLLSDGKTLNMKQRLYFNTVNDPHTISFGVRATSVPGSYEIVVRSFYHSFYKQDGVVVRRDDFIEETTKTIIVGELPPTTKPPTKPSQTPKPFPYLELDINRDAFTEKGFTYHGVAVQILLKNNMIEAQGSLENLNEFDTEKVNILAEVDWETPGGWRTTKSYWIDVGRIDAGDTKSFYHVEAEFSFSTGEVIVTLKDVNYSKVEAPITTGPPETTAPPPTTAAPPTTTPPVTTPSPTPEGQVTITLSTTELILIILVAVLSVALGAVVIKKK